MMTNDKNTMIVVGHDGDDVVIVIDDVEAEFSIRLDVKDAQKLIRALNIQIAFMERETATAH